MGGIAGLIDTDRGRDAGSLQRLADSMAAELKHRGPDGAGSFADAEAGVAIGSRRLAIQEAVENGIQPMESPNGRYVVAVDGGIFNFMGLRADLEAVGERNWRDGSDTEVMLRAITRLGVMGALDRFDGSFAFALWDKQARRLYLVRDRMGEKPLYFGWCGGHFVFASELKALTIHPEWKGEIDRESLASFMRYRHVPAPRSIYRDISKLAPGHWLAVDAASLRSDGIGTPQAYWDLRSVAERGVRNPFQGDDDAAVAELERLLTDSVRNRMQARVPVGALLSGGPNSSLVVSLMQRLAEGPVRTFTIHSADGRDREGAMADHVAKELGVAHTNLEVDADSALNLVDRMPRIYDEPIADTRQLSAFLFAQMTREHVGAVLTGGGGDPLFWGHPRYAVGARLWAQLARRPAWRRALAATLSRQLPLRVFNRISNLPQLPLRLGDRLYRLLMELASGAPEQIFERMTSLWRTVDAPMPRPVTGYFLTPGAWPDLEGPMARFSYADLVTDLPNGFLASVDRAAMAVGLEVRAPLLSRPLAEFAWRLPNDFKYREGRPKWILETLLARYCPDLTISKTQPGFVPPVAAWLRGPLHDWAGDHLSPESLKADGLIDPEPILTVWNEHRQGVHDWSGELWNVLMYLSWRAEWR